MSRRKPTRTRRVREDVKPKIRQVEAITSNHEVYMDSIDNNLITICTGPAGCGKTFLATGMFANYLHEGEFDQIVVTRPIAPYLKPIEENLKFFLGQSYYGHYLNNKQIRYEPLETMRGMTFNRTLMLLDEAQNCTFEQIKMFITRIGKDSKIVINGDSKQTDIKNKSGLDLTIDRLYNAHIDGLGVCELGYEDIQSNGIIGDILKYLED